MHSTDHLLASNLAGERRNVFRAVKRWRNVLMHCAGVKSAICETDR